MSSFRQLLYTVFYGEILFSMVNTLDNWLSTEIKSRDWSFRELARRAGISHTSISNVLSGQRQPGWDFCTAIAKALNVPPEEVFRRAGLLPPKPEIDEEAEEVLHLFQQLGEEQRQLALQTLRTWVNMQ